MQGKSRLPPAARHDFFCHLPTDRVGILISVSTVGIAACKTVRFAGGEIVSAPASEFRPATVAEIQQRHRAAASVRPLVLSSLPVAQHGGLPAS